MQADSRGDTCQIRRVHARTIAWAYTLARTPLLRYELIDRDSGVYDVVWSSTLIGNYSLSARMDGCLVDGSPVPLTVTPLELCLKNCRLVIPFEQVLM